jgi:glycosyltransferase involved in cell wall biosynthesis
MKIVIDARMISWTGIGRYTRALIEHLQTLDTDNDYLLLLQKQDFDSVALTNDHFKKIEANFSPYSFGEQLRLPSLIKSLKPDLVHFLGPNAPILYFGKRITTIFDFTLLDYKNVRRNPLVYEIKYLAVKLCFWRSIKASKYIITISTFVKNQVSERYHISHFNIVPIFLAADGFSAKPEPIDRFKINGPFLLFVGNSYPYKNLLRLVESFRKVKETHQDLKLIIVGKDDIFYKPIHRRIQELHLEDSVTVTGFVSDGELVSFYKHSKMFVFPSLSEGFGLPGLEAMLEGLPVIAANNGCLPEVYADAAEYFNPYSIDDMATNITSLLDDKKRLEELTTKGYARVNQFSWEKMASLTLDLYKSSK